MKTLLAAMLVALALPVLAVAAVAGGHVRIVAWASAGSGKESKDPPKNAVAGGTLCTPAKITKLVAYVRFDGMHNGDPSSADWFYNGKKVYSFPFKWEDGSSGKTAFDLHKASATLDAGRYGIQVRTNGRQVGAAAIALKYGGC